MGRAGYLGDGVADVRMQEHEHVPDAVGGEARAPQPRSLGLERRLRREEERDAGRSPELVLGALVLAHQEEARVRVLV